MMISSRGTYALRVLCDLAAHRDGSYVALKDIVERQGMSQKYLEGIMTSLSKGGLVDGVHGRGGGYRLCRAPKDYTLGEILRLTEGDLAPVSCVEQGAPECANAGRCAARPIWDRLNTIINDYLDSVTLEDLVSEADSGSPESCRN